LSAAGAEACHGRKQCGQESRKHFPAFHAPTKGGAMTQIRAAKYQHALRHENRRAEHLIRRTVMRQSKLLGLTVVASLLLLITGQQATWAQSGAGSIQGTVTDSTGAAIPGASIHVVNDATAVATDTRSNGVGFYQVPELFAGHYTVTVTASGMKTYKTSIELLVAQDAVINPALAAGAVTQQIVVAGDAVQLTTTDNGAIASTLENARINQLPMNGRTLTTLLGDTVPGLENGGKDINGLMPSAVIYTVDGVTTQDNLRGGLFYGSGGSQLLDPDSVQEVRMETQNSGAEYSTPATAIITTKSGTNQMHGTFFETARNNGFGVAKNRQDKPNVPAPHLVRNEFGASAGGPVILPHLYHGKDKTFWFFAFERFSLEQSVSTLTNVPTTAMSQGNFSGLINASGILQTLYDPSTTTNSSKCAATGAANAYCRTPFANNTIPVSEEPALAKLYYQLVPQPGNTANPLVTNNLTTVTPESDVEPQETFRLDHAFNENNRAFLRYTQNLQGTNVSSGPQNLPLPGIPAGAAVSQAGYLNNPTDGYFAGLGYTHVFSPTFFAETIINQQWFSERKLAGAAALTPTVDYESMLGLPNNFGELGFPLLGNGGLIFNLGSSQTNTARETQIISSADENLTKTLGRHQMQFGGRFRHERMALHPQEAADAISFSNLSTALYNTSSGVNYTAVSNTGNANGSFFLGSASSYQVYMHGGWDHYHDNEVDAYFQDNYHLSRDLTINLGLRYEAHPAVATEYGRITGFDLKNDAEVLGASIATMIADGFTQQSVITNDENIGVKFETAQQAGQPANTLMNNYNLVFLPRVGIAYQPFNGKYGTVIRGAYGRFANPVPLEDFLEYIAGHDNPFTIPYTQSYTSASQAIDAQPNELIRYNDPVVFGQMGANTSNVINSNSTNGVLPGIAEESASPSAPPQYITQTNLTIEQPLKGNSVLRISGIWTHANNLALTDDYNHPLTTYEWELATGTAPPTGGASVIGTPQQNTYSATALGPYDQATWGGNSLEVRTGWSNDYLAQATYQRLFHHGSAYQISYVYAHELRVGGDNQGTVPNPEYPIANYPGGFGTNVGSMTSPYGTLYPGVLPPTPPAGFKDWQDYHAMIKYQGYMLDNTNAPIHHITFNGIFDLPVGRGKRFLGNANRFLDELVGGYQFAGDGNIASQVFQPSAGNYGQISPVQVYKQKYPTVDCTSGVCEKSFLWFNGYLAPTVTTGLSNSACTTNCVTGLPTSYVPMQTPIDATPGTTYYNDNDVLVTLANKTTATVAYDAGPQASDYLSKSWLNGPINYTVDLSVFKVFPITEKTNLRFNMDAFNALNVQGFNNPGTNGLEHMLNSHNTARQLQLTLRLTF
jgi:hypothetical protein